MKAAFLLLIALSFASVEYLTTTGCHESCQVCFKNSLDFCYVCKPGLFFDISGICTAEGVVEEGKECPAYTYMDPSTRKCRSCPFECNVCLFNEERGGVDCTECFDTMGMPENNNLPYEAFGVKGCHCFGYLDQGYCTYCNSLTQEYSEETMSCIKKIK